MTTAPTTTALRGFTVGVTAHRRAAEQRAMLQRLGVEVLDAPALAFEPVGATEALSAATELLIADPPTHTVLTTAIGVRAWVDAAEQLGRADALLAALGSSRVLARGPKARAAALAVGLPVAVEGVSGRSAELVERLAAEAGTHRVCVQLDGDPNAPLAAALRAGGIDAVTVQPYRWQVAEHADGVARLVAAICDGRLDAVTFTARPQVLRVVAVARALGLERELLARCEGATAVVCVGPVCGDAARDAGLGDVHVAPAWRIGALVRTVGDVLHTRVRRLRVGATDIVQQGRLLVAGDHEVLLSERERGVFDALAARPGAVVSKSRLLADVWQGAESDPHVVEVTVGRLRRRLGPVGDGIETVVRRGYRLAAA